MTTAQQRILVALANHPGEWVRPEDMVRRNSAVWFGTAGAIAKALIHLCHYSLAEKRQNGWHRQGTIPLWEYRITAEGQRIVKQLGTANAAGAAGGTWGRL